MGKDYRHFQWFKELSQIPTSHDITHLCARATFQGSLTKGNHLKLRNTQRKSNLPADMCMIPQKNQ